MSVPPAPAAPGLLPPHSEFAQAFLAEGVRHLEDALVLHQNGRFAGAITSSMKAAEFAIKASLILEGGVGFVDKLFSSHKPLTDTENNRVFRIASRHLSQLRPGLPNDVKKLEALAPKPFGAGNFTADEANTEYPYLRGGRDALGRDVALLVSPHSKFDDAESKNQFNVARETIETLAATYPGR